MSNVQEKYPLAWPDGVPRTMIGDRETRKAWKKTERQSFEALSIELQRFGVLSASVTRKDPQDIRTAPDPSVAVHFARKKEDDFSWQGALGITNPAPTIEEIDAAFKRLAAKYHPDNQATGDHETYLALDRHRRAALAYVNRASGKQYDYCIACDRFKEARWNMIAVAHTIRSFRQMERDGTSRIVERAMTGFAELPQEAGRVHATAAS